MLSLELFQLLGVHCHVTTKLADKLSISDLTVLVNVNVLGHLVEGLGSRVWALGQCHRAWSPGRVFRVKGLGF